MGAAIHGAEEAWAGLAIAPRDAGAPQAAIAPHGAPS
jgi:hypothetical protein